MIASSTALRAALFGVLVATPLVADAALFPTTVTPISLGSATYSQDFNSLSITGNSATLPAGFQIFEGAGSQGNSTYTAGTGSDNGGGVYSFGAANSSDRALGSIRSGNIADAFYGAFFTNALSTAITGLDLGYTGEQWRNGSASSDSLLFQYSLDATAINNGAWTTVNALTFTSPAGGATAGALNGNAAANRQSLSFTLSDLSIAANATFAIRWVDQPVSSGAQDGLAADDFSITATRAVAVVPEPATWAMMLFGFGAIGGALRRRATTTTTTFA